MEKMYCYVGDVLGFSDMVSELTLDEEKNLTPDEIARFTPEERAKRVDSWTKLVEREIDKHDISHYQFVSDTIFVGVEPNNGGLERLIKFSKDMLNNGIENSLPLRAGIAYGDVEWREKISFGTALINAHKLEEEQNWIGTCCESDLPGIENLWDFEKVFCYPTPLKTERLLTYRPVISWNVPKYRDLRNKTSVNAIRHKYVTWRYDSLIQNTILFSMYKNLIVNNVLEKAKPSSFGGHLMEILEFYIDDICHEKYLQDKGLKKQFIFRDRTTI
jgi:hypothetical protein